VICYFVVNKLEATLRINQLS